MNHTTRKTAIIGLALGMMLGCAAETGDREESALRMLAQANTVEDGALEIVFTKTSDWGSGYNGRFDITNVSDQAVSDWNAFFTLPPLTTVDWCYREGTSIDSCEPFQPRNGETAQRIVPDDEVLVLAPGETVSYVFGGETESDVIATMATCQYFGSVGDDFRADQVPCDGSDNVDHPIVPTGVTVSEVTETAVSLSWDPNPENDVIAYRVYGDVPLTDVLEPNATVTIPVPDPTMFFRVAAIDSAGNISNSGVSNSVEVEFPLQQVSFEVRIVSDWDGGYQADILMTNEGNDPITDWAYTFSQPGIESLWGAEWSVTEDSVSVTAPSYDNVLDPGNTAIVGYTVGVEGDEFQPGSFTFRGTSCPADGSVCPGE